MANFVLASLVDTPWTSTQVQDALAREGLFVRECSNYRGLEIGSVVTGFGESIETAGHIRFCVRSRVENELLLSTLTNIMTSNPRR
jgi:threonine-phosphate decarboxylase